MNAREAARLYMSRGWCPVPIPVGEKGPRTSGWQNLRIGLDAVEQLKQYADAIGVGVSTVQSLIEAGELHTLKFGNQLKLITGPSPADFIARKMAEQASGPLPKIPRIERKNR